MQRLARLAALAVLPGAALAQPGTKTQIDIKVRAFGSGDPFVDSLSFVHPDHSPAVVEVAVFYYREAGIGLATVIHNIVGSPFSSALGDAAAILDDNPTSTLHPDGRVGNFNFGGQFQAVYHTGTTGVDANRFRIAASNNPDDLSAGGISVKQNTPIALGTTFNTADGVLGYHFKLMMACPTDGSSRTMTLDAPKNSISSFAAYQIGTDFPPLNPMDTDVALVTIAALAPASLSMLVLGLIPVARRSRR